MKKASFTLFQPQRWMSKGRSTLAVLFVMCIGLTTLSAQTDPVKMPNGGVAGAAINACPEGSTGPMKFTDDGDVDGLYADSESRSDTITFCPNDVWHRVQVVFTEFDVAAGDTLFAFQGDKAALDAAGAAALQAAGAAAGNAPAVNTAGAALAAATGNAADTVSVPEGTSAEALQDLAGTTTVDSAAVVAAAASGFLPSGLDLSNPTILAAAINALQALIDAVGSALDDVSTGTIDGGNGASDGTGSGAGVGSTAFAVGRGGSVSDAFGGWIDASCNPGTNASGCLTFVFETNGDRAKGTGWEAWVSCGERNVSMTDDVNAVSIATEVLDCGESFATIELPLPYVTSCSDSLANAVDTLGLAADGTTILDSIIVTVTNSRGMVCLDTTLSREAGNMPVERVFAPGFYTVNYKIKSDQHESKQKNSTITVQAPNLVCNDNIQIPFGSACDIAVTPDMILEAPCDTISNDTMNYVINIYIGNDTISGTAKNPPILTSEKILAENISLCGGTARVEIIRTFGDVWSNVANAVCDNGAQTQSCSTTMTFEDKSAPVFIGHTPSRDTLVACDGDDLASLVRMPVAIDNCVDTAAISHEMTGDTDFSDACVASRTIVIKYTAVDSCNNKSETTDTVVVLRPWKDVQYGRDLIVDAKADEEFQCGSSDDSDSTPRLLTGKIENGVFVPSTTVGDTITLSTTEYKCGYILTSDDITIPAPGCGKKVYRYWSITDWCAPQAGPSPVDTQFINYKDTEAPVFAENPNATQATAAMINLGAFECSTDAIPAAPTANDACSGAARVEAGDPVVIDGEIVDGKYTCGTYSITYTAHDQCDNSATTTVFFTVKDVTPPSAICTDELIVSIGSGAVRITASDLDAGSYDACEDLTFKVRRADTEEWLDYVALTCEDKPSVEVELQVTGSKSEPVTCWSKITVEDKIAPVCNVLADHTRLCTDFHPDQYGDDGELVAGSTLADFYNTNFGNPFDGCSDNCVTLTTQYQSIDVTKGDCGQITIERTYKVVDWAGHSSAPHTQTITVNPVSDFKLTFPADQEIKCSDADQTVVTALTLDDILTENNGCDIFALEVTEKEFTVDGDFCKKIERTYEVINWCTYTPGTPALSVDHVAAGDAMVTDESANGRGRFVYTQVIKYSVDQAPEVSITAPEMCISSGCSETKTFAAAAENCLGAALTDFTYNLTVTDADGVVTKVHENEEGHTFDVVVVPGSTYDVEFWGFDDCGNSDGATGSYTFMDCVRPTPYVLNGLAVEIMQTGEIAVWASDLDRGSFDNCTKTERLEILIALGTPDEGPGRDADAAAIRAHAGNQVTFNCDLLGTTQFVSIYVIDEKGNWDVVGTYVFVQDNLGTCPGVDPMSGRVAGKVTNAFGENVELVNVTVNGGDNSMATNATGEFAFNLPLDGDYTITPEKNINPLNGVSTFDLVLISKHILGLQQFDSPYKYIAADVNKSGSITAFDMVQLRQLILNVTSEFTNNTSWRFVDAKHEFTSANPAAENFDEFMSINNLEGEMLNVDFIAAKIGDVNGTATANSLLGAESRNINGTLNLNVTDQLVAAGETVTVDFTSADIAAAQGYQFTMDFAGLNLVELTEGVAKAANFNTNIAERGVLTTSWNGEATANDVLFSLTFTAATNGLLSELISVNSDLTVAEAYNNAGELMNVALDFNTTNVAAAFGLNQNTPNPFNGETVIGFNLPEAGAATLTVMDVQGKVLTVIERDGVKGYNQVTINAKTLNATGVLYYQLESADNIATKKMIIIE